MVPVKSTQYCKISLGLLQQIMSNTYISTEHLLIQLTFLEYCGNENKMFDKIILILRLDRWKRERKLIKSFKSDQQQSFLFPPRSESEICHLKKEEIHAFVSVWGIFLYRRYVVFTFQFSLIYGFFALSLPALGSALGTQTLGFRN